MPMLSSHFRVLFGFLVCTTAFGESLLRDNVAARELIELVIDRVEMAEPVARYNYSVGMRKVEDDKNNPSSADIAIFKTANLDAEAFAKAQDAAFSDRQRQLFALWKATGVDGFDDVDDVMVTVRPQLRKNAEEEMKRLGALRPVLCTRTVVADMNEVASPVLRKRSMDANLIQPVVKSLESIARDDSVTCDAKKRHRDEK